jgi:hypothetical protein
MSYDLAVWHESTAIDSRAAQQKYEAMCAGVHPPTPHESVAQFVNLVTQQYPQIDDCDEDDIDDCPGTCEFDVSPAHCILNIRWGREEELVPELVHIAMDLGLICYDPQSGRVYSPGQIA